MTTDACLARRYGGGDVGRGMAEPAGRRELILGMLRVSSQPRSIVDLAGQLRVHPNSVRFHHDALLRNGQVEQLLADATGLGRPPTVTRAGLVRRYGRQRPDE